MPQVLNVPMRGAGASSSPYRSPLLHYQSFQYFNSPNTGTAQVAFPSQTSAQAAQIGQRGNFNQVTGTTNDGQPMLRTASPPVSQRTRTPPFVAVQLQPSGTRSVLNYATGAQHCRPTFAERSAVGTAQPVSVAETSGTSASTDNWRPTGRMRGSLTGKAYADALKLIQESNYPISGGATN
ncbi:hypothetical protein JCGZ_14329 [Jatropha curcas]|uniref:Uncharacterized protein n=1 Tax=Jatropha curcas TaxID=180498 RepID=A0A067K0F8_JATCU|nr:hypothetical protein JCGZ_14329 [Jatropha curcas]